MARGQNVVVAGEDNWVTPHRFLPVDSDGARDVTDAEVPDNDVHTPCRGLGRDGLRHLFGLPGARNALCGMAAAQEQSEPAAPDARATCQRCLSAPPIERH